MASNSPLYKVLVAGPGDVVRERNAVTEAINTWTRRHGEQTGVIMQAVSWTQAHPDMSADAQAVINRQLGKIRDAVIAVFGKRIGTATPRAISGTVEEIEEAIAEGKDVMVYFSSGPIGREGLDLEQLAKLEEFRRSLESRGLLGSYRSLPDLKTQLDDHVTSLGYEVQRRRVLAPAREQGTAAAAPQRSESRPEDQAILTILPGDNDAGPWIYSLTGDGRAQVKYRLQNIGRAPARDIRARVTIGQGEPVDIEGPRLLPSLATADREGFVLPLLRPFPGAPGSPVPEDYPDSDVIRIVLSYSDFQHHLGVQQTEPFCFRFARSAEHAQWRSQVEPCEPVQETANPSRETTRPRNLTARDHEVLKTLVRRAAIKPQVFQPTILTHRMGDDKQLYASQLHRGAAPDPEDVPNFEHDRDFIPTLVQQSLLIPVRHNEYMMDESLFRAYGLEPPI
jgi:hypothetical protein